MDETASFLMEKLRTKSGNYKSYKEYSKSLRMTLLEKRYALEVSEKNYLQECLDILQQNILVSTLPAIIERLEVISRHLGLKFVSGTSNYEWFISSDMFYVEVVLEPNGDIKDVKIHHENNVEQQNCEELKTTLENRNFKDFTLQLEGLISIYNLNAEKRVKSKAFSSLQYLEADIVQLSELQCSFMRDPFLIIHKSEVGLVQKRRGGHPMKIIYFISPYDLLDITKKTYKPLTLDLPEVDYSVSLCLESSSTNKLQTQPLVKIIKSEKVDENQDSPQATYIFEELTTSNTNLLPACFVMKLKERMPICESLIEQMKEITDIEVNKMEGPFPILSLIKREIHKKFVECDEDSSIVTLPDQRHCYIMTENYDLQAYIVQSIPFSHPSHVSRILPLLRQQALFNSFISSCVRPKAAEDVSDKQNKTAEMPSDSEYCNGFGLKFFGSEDFKDLNNSQEPPQKLIASDITMFEVIPLSLQQITVSFEHPIDETLITAELDLSDVSELRCDISTASEDPKKSVADAQECACRALQRSFSIPATMRALIRLWESQSDSSDEEDLNESSTNNDVADLNENVENNMESEITRENGEYPTGDFNPSVPIKLEKSDSCENSLDGFPALANRNPGFRSDEMFEIPTTAPTLSFDTEMSVAGPSNSFNITEPLPAFLENANEPQPGAFEPKVEPMDTESFFNRKAVTGGGGGDSYNTPKLPTRLPNECEIVIDSSSDSEQPVTPRKDIVAETKDPSPGSSSSLDFAVLTELTADASVHDKPQTNYEMMDDSIEDVEQFLKITETKIPKNENSNALTSSVLSELENKNLVPPSVSITPITSAPSATPASSSSSSSSSSLPSTTIQCNAALQSVISSMGLERRPGIEIIPISSTPPNIPTSLTITPIPPKEILDDRQKPNDRKKLKTPDDKVRIEKKKKRKHDDSPMGPPEKIPAKSDPLSKPVSLSIKTTDSPSPRSPSPSNPLRKCTVSPTTQFTSVTMISKGSPNSSGANNNNIKSSKSQNLTSSPNPISSSPKIGLTSSSPKHSLMSSPKSMSSGGSGKPCISSLKPIVTSPSSNNKINNEMKTKTHKDSSGRDHKDKKSSSNGSGSGSGHQSPKLKSSSVKSKQLEVPTASVVMLSSYDSSLASAIDAKKAFQAAQCKNKKESLSAIVDKLKLQKHTGDGPAEEDCGNGNNAKNSAPAAKEMKNAPQVIRAEDAKNLAAAKASEGYRVKTTSDGMKLSIKVSRPKDSSSNSGSIKNSSIQPGSGSPKHTSSKSLTNSTTSCKKSLPYKGPVSGSSSSSSSSSNKPSSSGGLPSSKHSSKSSSSSKSKTNHSPKGSSSHSTDANRKDKIRSSSSSKTHSDSKNIFTGMPKRSSPANQESGDDEKPFKSQPPLENFIKHLNTNFQIPKLSERDRNKSGNEDVKKSESSSNNVADERIKEIKTESGSPAKIPFVSLDDRAIIDSSKISNSYEMKPKCSSENNIDAMNAPSHAINSNCSISAAVQSNDGIKLNL